MTDLSGELKFPMWGLIPKQETGVSSFLTKYPEYDGRDITIAIFDTGVDPGAPGMQTTSTNKVKVVERFDCSGCGDVVTSTIVLPNENGDITGLTGRTLKIPKSWNNPSNKFHIGVKNAYDLYPTKLKERVELERKEKLWDEQHKIAIASATRDLQKFENELKKINGNLTDNDTLMKEDYEHRLEFLNNLEKKYTDLGPVYDCVVFYDGSIWRVCIDTTEEGDLENAIFLGEYSKTHQYSALTATDQLNISVNVHENGNLLEIVSLCTGHGTHVASIAAAYFEEGSEKNGVAPGAQIVSLTIGDGRLGSMETGTAIVRAIIKVMELHKTNPIHVINMSYGEHAHWSNAGRIGELMHEVINKYNIVWVVSAGNHGPALCTVGAPPDVTHNSAIGVGAYVSSEMMIAEYSLRQKLPGMAFTWSSRGPCIDGDYGVSVCAPGAAITSVPNFTLRNAQLLNGTSMAAPHVAGAICLLLSGLRKKDVLYSPYFIKRSIEVNARFLEHIEVFAQGHGLLQVEKAFDYLITYNDCPAVNVHFSLSCGTSNGKGIHIRNALNQPLEYNVSIEPKFLESSNVTPTTKIKFRLHLALICKSSFVQCPAFLDLQNVSRTISIKIDTSGLPHGAHFTTIDAFDVNCPEKGLLFSIPITIIQPMKLKKDSNYELQRTNELFHPNTIKRYFITIPENATMATLRLRSAENGKQGRFIIHCMQLLPKKSCKTQECHKVVQITSQNDTLIGVQVKGGFTLEVVIAKYWASIGDIELNYSITLRGIKPNDSCITMMAADGIHQLDIRCLQLEDVAPVITLKSSVQVLRPTDYKLSPLSVRDIIPIGRQIYELVLTYEFHITKAVEVIPNCSMLSDVLYESEFESQLWMIFDINKQYIFCGDAYASKYAVKLERGDYTLKLQIRHDKKDLLEKINDIPLLLSRKLSNSITLDVYSSYSQAIIQGKKMSVVNGSNSSSIPIFIPPFLNDKSKMSSFPGQYLTGTITFAKEEFYKRIDIYPFKFYPVEGSKKLSSKSEKDKNKLEDIEETLKEVNAAHLQKIDVQETATEFYEKLKVMYPNELPIHSAMLQSISPMEVTKQLPLFDPVLIRMQEIEIINMILTISNYITDSINVEKLLSNLAIKTDHRAEAIKSKSIWERQKTALIDALCRKGISYCRLFLMTNESSVELKKDISVVWNEMLKFVDINDIKGNATNVLLFISWHATIHKHYGRVLKYLGKLYEEKPQKEIELTCAEVCSILGWDHCASYIRKSLFVKYPVNYRPF